MQAFLRQEASSGVLLLVATVAALVWANSPWSDFYHRLWHTTLGLHVGGFAISQDLVTWIDEPVLGLFFLVVGLELKRELLTGELRDRRGLALPALAALAGMAVPALLYSVVNIHSGAQALNGWAIPMATDVPFALGLLVVAGRGLPPVLRSFLLTLAIVDDIATLAVIGLFYSGQIRALPLAVTLVLLAAMWGMFQLRLHAVPLYVALGAVVLVASMRSGIHAPLAGVALGLIVPAGPFQRPAAVSAEAHRVADETVDDPDPPDADAQEWLYLAALSHEAVSPLARLEAALHPWTSNLVVPVFALANAGVTLTRPALAAALGAPVFVGIVLARVVGKIVGLPLGAFLGTASRLARMPAGLRWADLIALGGAAGVGFTVSLFVVQLAFPSGPLADQAKLGLLTGTALAAVAGTVLMAVARRGHSAGGR